MTDPATLDDRGDGGAVLRFERALAHPPEQVFRAISEPEELRHWFPAGVEWELRPGAPIRFAFEPGDEDTPGGEVLAVEPPRLLRYRWGDDVLAWEITPEGAGCRLVFTHVLAPGGMSGGLPGAARNAAGWDACLAALAARLDGEPPPDVAWFPPFEDYVERFGLGGPRATADGVRFERDVVQPPEEVRAALAEADWPEARIEVRPSTPGSLLLVDVAEADAEALAAWQVRLELLVAALAGEARDWPEERDAALAARYRSRSVFPPSTTTTEPVR